MLNADTQEQLDLLDSAQTEVLGRMVDLGAHPVGPDLRRLVALGIVTVNPGREDGPRIIIRATAEGRKTLSALRAFRGRI